MAKKKSNNMLLAVGAAVVALFMFGKKKTVHHGSMYDGRLPHEDILHDYAEGYEQNVHDMGDRENSDNPFKPIVEPGINTGTNTGGSPALNTEVNLKPRY